MKTESIIVSPMKKGPVAAPFSLFLVDHFEIGVDATSVCGR
jgi:hypothetical protein